MRSVCLTRVTCQLALHLEVFGKESLWSLSAMGRRRFAKKGEERAESCEMG